MLHRPAKVPASIHTHREDTMKFDVEGMTCGHCIRAITRAIHTLDPDARVDVDLALGMVTVEGQLLADAVADAITREGYRVRDRPPG
jgi:copper chaperone